MPAHLEKSGDIQPSGPKARPNDRMPDAQADQTKAAEGNDPLLVGISKAGGIPSDGAHAAALNRVAASQPARAGQSVLRLQRQYGNHHVQRVLNLARKGNGNEAAPDMLSRSLNARAFTTGQDIFFRRGAYSPGTSSGRELLAHELTHVVQQRGDNVRRKPTLDQPGEHHDQEADQVARAILQRELHRVQKDPRGALVQRQVKEDKDQPLQTQLGPNFNRIPLHTDTRAGVIARSVHARTPTLQQRIGPGRRSAYAGIIQRKPGWLESVAEAGLDVLIPGRGVSRAMTKLLTMRRASALRTRLARLKPRIQLAERIRFSDELWMRFITLVRRLATLLPFPVPILSTALSGLMSPQGVIMGASAIALPAALLALLAAVEYLLLIILAFIIAMIILWLIERIIEIIEEAIEAMRNQPPILWSTSLPLPGPIGMPVVRTKPPNPRIPGGGQSIVQAQIRASGMSGIFVAHHILPLFLGGTDILANVTPLRRDLHIIGHPSLQVQPQMAVWGYPISLYSHPPPPGYFIAGVKPP